MKYFIIIVLAVCTIIVSCSKERTARDFPPLASDVVTELTSAQIAWLEQIAKQKRDSMNKVDSLIALGAVVDTNSLFHKKNKMIAIVEVNDHFFPNVLYYLDSATRKPIFDLAFPFSANMNIDPATNKAYVSYNPQHQEMLQKGIFRQVMQGGVPVGLSLLGNHDAAGWGNFTSEADAIDFAQKVAFEVRQKGFSAVLSDDEYSGAPAGTPLPNSYVMAMYQIKQLLPDIFLCYYVYGGGSGTYKGKQMGDVADALFGAFYPQYITPVYNAPNSKMYPSTSETDGGFGDVAGTVQRAKNDGYGGFMFYNVWGTSNSPSFYAPYLKALRGKTLYVPPGKLNGQQKDFINTRP